METDESPHESPNPHVRSPEQKRRRRRTFLSAGVVVFCIAWVGLNLYRFPYVAYLPGSTSVVDKRISVRGTDQYRPKGEVLWATVLLKRDVRFLDLINAKLRDGVDLVDREQQLGKLTNKEAERISRSEMEDAKLIARVVAGRVLGFSTTGGGATVIDIEPGVPAAKVLRVGDVIVRAESTPVCIQGDLGQVMVTKRPGERVTMTIRRGGTEREVDVPTLPEATRTRRGRAPRAVIGIYLGPVKDTPCSLPFDVTIDTSKIGGPSAGLAMTLAVVDRLSKGELTGGVRVAATGTIEADGTVGVVGGVKQKTASVRAAGAKLFLVPIEEVAEATRYAGPMQVVGVRTLDDALAALRKAGGEPLPSPSR
jgi:Lon-like protease